MLLSWIIFYASHHPMDPNGVNCQRESVQFDITTYCDHQAGETLGV
jgi:hypothetical protein